MVPSAFDVQCPPHLLSTGKEAIRPQKREGDEPQIGNVDEGIVEGGENTGHTEDESAC